MSDEILKTGDKILDEYFHSLSQNPEIDSDLREMLLELWEQKRLYTKTYLVRALDELRDKKSK